MSNEVVFMDKHGERRDTPKFGFRKYVNRDGKLYPFNHRARHRAMVKLNKVILAGKFDHGGHIPPNNATISLNGGFTPTLHAAKFPEK